MKHISWFPALEGFIEALIFGRGLSAFFIQNTFRPRRLPQTEITTFRPKS
jgi:hypothetical protein